MKISVFITAHISMKDEPCNEDAMVIYSHDFDDYNFLNSNAKWPFLNWLDYNFPLIDWEFDDGFDTCSTGYCQYAAYTEGIENIGNYVLATLEVNED